MRTKKLRTKKEVTLREINTLFAELLEHREIALLYKHDLKIVKDWIYILEKDVEKSPELIKMHLRQFRSDLANHIVRG